MNQSMPHHGLRSLNQVDLLNTRTNVKVSLQQARRKGLKHENGRPWAVVVCGIGMNVVFVSAEVAPWSKTGGLGDVLGGLPPAMAVNLLFFLVCVFCALNHNMVINHYESFCSLTKILFAQMIFVPHMYSLFSIFWIKSYFTSDTILQANGHRVMTVSPRYDQYKDSWDTGVSVEV